MSNGQTWSKEDPGKIFEAVIAYASEEAGVGTSSENNYRRLNKREQKTVHSLHKFIATGKLPDSRQDSKSLLDSCNQFVGDFENVNTKSTALQQLITLINRPHIQGLLWSTDEISEKRYSPQLPEIPFEVDEDEGIAVKIVRIVRRDEPLGATIRCERGKVFVARIMANGVADRSGCIQEGDRVLEVNGESVTNKNTTDIVSLLNKCENGIVTFKLMPAEVCLKLASKKSMHRYVRAMFDYDAFHDSRHPCPEAAISFQAGDILEILDEKDTYWWQARRLGFGALAKRRDADGDGSSKKVGLIPSELLQYKLNSDEDIDDNDSDSTEKHKEKYYEPVFRWKNRSKKKRVVVLLGPPGVGRNEIRRQFFKQCGEKFTNAIPHTSRQPRPNEVNGFNYYFSSRDEMEDMIKHKEMLEYGEFRDNLYGTTLESVRIARQKGTPLLTPHPLALENIRNADFTPIVIFIQPPPFKEFKATRDAYRAQMTRAQSAASSNNTSQTTVGRGFTDSEIEQIIENANIMERKYGHMIDAKLVNSELDYSMNDLTHLITQLENRTNWMPIKWATQIGD